MNNLCEEIVYGVSSYYGKDHETIFEGTYRFEVASGVVIQPDYQVILVPGARQDSKTAHAAYFWFEIKF